MKMHKKCLGVQNKRFDSILHGIKQSDGPGSYFQNAYFGPKLPKIGQKCQF